MTTIHGNEEFVEVTPIKTWAEIWQNCHDSRWLLWMLEWVSHTDYELRLFACWCARQAWRTIGFEYFRDCFRDLVETAERFARGAVNQQEMVTVRKSCGGAGPGASRIGMPMCSPYAAAQLATVATCWDEARKAAWSAAWYAATAAGFKAAREEADRVGWEEDCEERRRERHRIRRFIDKNPSIPKEAEEIARAEQADGLRQIVGNPMLRNDQKVPIPAQTLAYWMTWGFVPEKVHGSDLQFSSDLLGAQYSFNTLVEECSPSGVVVCTTDTRD